MPIITACSQDCPDTRSLVVETSPSGRVRINGNPDHPLTAGFCCAKMKSWHRRLSNPHRITAALLRDGAGWRDIGWEEALEICAAMIQALRANPYPGWCFTRTRTSNVRISACPSSTD